MAKYQAIYDKYEFEGLRIVTFNAKDDLEALLKTYENIDGAGYADNNGNYYYDEDFKAPTMEELVEEINMNNGEAISYLFVVKNLDKNEVIFKCELGYEESIENW